MGEKHGYPEPSPDKEVQKAVEHQENQDDNELPSQGSSGSDDEDDK